MNTLHRCHAHPAGHVESVRSVNRVLDQGKAVVLSSQRQCGQRTPLTRNTSKRGRVIFSCMFLLLCGDVQVNPGPVAPLKHQVGIAVPPSSPDPFHQEHKVTLRQTVWPNHKHSSFLRSATALQTTVTLEQRLNYFKR
ncbi:hypothetical protein XENORESO_019611 [Xenotaenia resolanae]|uniref:Uncharacterized protein n=1 Tax=Xenotaenia resolanae TaxID=208358 RepID=A0ABV0VN11_9TELE